MRTIELLKKGILKGKRRAPPSFPSGWLYRKKVTIDQTQVDADLTDFPVKVSLQDSDIIAKAKRNKNDIVFTAADGTTKLNHELVKKSYLGKGGWCWFSNPRAIRFVGIHDKTYVGTIDIDGNLYVGEYSPVTNIWTHTLLTAALEADDHDNPALFIRPSDNRLIAFYSKHSNDTLLRYKVSTNPEDSTSWGTEQTYTTSQNNSYANPFTIASDSNACYVVSRVVQSSGYQWVYRRTTDYSTWDAQASLWNPGLFQEYIHLAQNGPDRVDFFASDRHPDNDTGNSSLFHFYCEWDSGTSALKWYNSAGTEISRPIDSTEATKVYDADIESMDGWGHQIAIDSTGKPRVLFQKRVSTTGTGDIRCMFSRWNGSAWTTPVEIVAHGGYVYSGEQSYTGAGCFDGNDINKGYIGVQVSGVYEIQEWITSNDGTTWVKSADITSNTVNTSLNIRPFSPIGHDDNIAVVYNNGRYTSFTASDMYLHSYPPLIQDAFVKIPSISGTVDTDIYCYYGNSNASAQENVTGTWDSGYKFVFHMFPENPGFTTRRNHDNLVNSTTGTKYGANSNGGYSILGTDVNFAGWDEATIECILSYTGAGTSSDNHTIFSNWLSPTNNAAMYLRISSTAAASPNRLSGFAIKEANTQVGGTFGAVISVDTEHHVAAVYDASTLRGYVDGVVGGTTYATSGGVFDASASVASWIGATPHLATPFAHFKGHFTEFRISDVARSEAYLKATNVNLNTPASFYSLDIEEEL